MQKQFVFTLGLAGTLGTVDKFAYVNVHVTVNDFLSGTQK